MAEKTIIFLGYAATEESIKMKGLSWVNPKTFGLTVPHPVCLDFNTLLPNPFLFLCLLVPSIYFILFSLA